MNHEIRESQVRLIDAEGEQCGVVSIDQALSTAREAGLDLVEVSPNAAPPVCRIMDYNRVRYEQKKKLQAQKKRKTQLKEIKFRPVTDIGDFNIKVRKIGEFIEAGHKVRVSVRFRGREMAHKDLGLEVLKRVQEQLEGKAQVEQDCQLEGRQMMMLFGPMKKK